LIRVFNFSTAGTLSSRELFVIELKINEIEQISGGIAANPVVNPVQRLPSPTPPYRGGPIFTSPEV